MPEPQITNRNSRSKYPMRIIQFIFIFCLAVVAISSCYYDVEEELYPVRGGCDTTNVTLSAKVKPILQTYCYACHSNTTAGSQGAGINIETYGSLKAQVDNGKLLKSIKHDPSASAMPKGSSALIPACNITVIEKWIAKGALNN